MTEKPKGQPQSTATKRPETTDAAIQMALSLKDWSIAPGDLSEMYAATQRSLDTVTHLTEYEDDKANRILTAMAFLSAFAAVIFAVVPSRYPLSFPFMLFRTGSRWEACLLIASYVGFVFYAVALIIGVAFVLRGMSPRFNIPDGWRPDGNSADGKKPVSRLFFAKIAEVSPTD